MTTVRVYGKAAPKPSGTSPLLAGILAAIGIIVLWVGLVYVTHNPVRVHFDQFLSKLGFWVLFLGTFELLDLLWIALGTWTAWTLGQGRI